MCDLRLLLVAMLAASALASDGPAPILNPRTYTSPSGQFKLEVDPSTMYGQGEGSYRVTRDGKPVWSATHPFTLWEAEITDDGTVAGYGYTHGVEGFPEKPHPGQSQGEFCIAIFDPSGKLRL